jgi:hypothetical protein
MFVLLKKFKFNANNLWFPPLYPHLRIFKLLTFRGQFSLSIPRIIKYLSAKNSSYSGVNTTLCN